MSLCTCWDPKVDRTYTTHCSRCRYPIPNYVIGVRRCQCYIPEKQMKCQNPTTEDFCTEHKTICQYRVPSRDELLQSKPVTSFITTASSVSSVSSVSSASSMPTLSPMSLEPQKLKQSKQVTFGSPTYVEPSPSISSISPVSVEAKKCSSFLRINCSNMPWDEIITQMKIPGSFVSFDMIVSGETTDFDPRQIPDGFKCHLFVPRKLKEKDNKILDDTFENQVNQFYHGDRSANLFDKFRWVKRRFYRKKIDFVSFRQKGLLPLPPDWLGNTPFDPEQKRTEEEVKNNPYAVEDNPAFLPRGIWVLTRKHLVELEQQKFRMFVFDEKDQTPTISLMMKNGQKISFSVSFAGLQRDPDVDIVITQADPELEYNDVYWNGRTKEPLRKPGELIQRVHTFSESHDIGKCRRVSNSASKQFEPKQKPNENVPEYLNFLIL